MRSYLLPAIFLFLITGCTHLQLQRSTIKQADTLDNIYQQQVLDNLAKFVQNPNALPHFAFPNEGAAQTTDSAEGSVMLNFNRAGFDTVMPGIGGRREVQLAWTMDPIRDPHKLARMRCAYQKAIANCCIGEVSTRCPNCPQILDEFYRNHGHPGDDQSCLDCAGCWFRWGTKKDLPKDCSCHLVGHYCGTYVYVPPEGQAQLTRLTLAILDYALYEPVEDVVGSKEVTIYLDELNNLVLEKDAKKKITATVPADQDVTDVTSITTGKAMKPFNIPNVKSFGSDSIGALQLRQRLDFLAPRSLPPGRR